MNLKLTPLNIFTSVCLVSAVYLLLFPATARFIGTISLLLLAVVCFISDILFRRYIKQPSRIWIVQLAFIIFAAVLVVLIKKI